MFEKLSRRTAQLAESMVDRVDNLIKEHARLLKENKDLKRNFNNLIRDYESLISSREIRDVLNKFETEKTEFIKSIMKKYEASAK